MIELFLNAIPNVLTAMMVGSTAGGLVQVCEEDIPTLSRLKPKLVEVMLLNEVDMKIITAFSDAFDGTYEGPKLPASCEETLNSLGTSKEDVINAIGEHKSK